MNKETKLGFNDMAEKQHSWLLARNLDTTIQIQSEKLLEEMPEAQEALAILQSDHTTENEKRFAEELIDVMIVSLGLMAIMGFDSEQMIMDKYNHNCDKYNLITMLQLQAEGLSPRQSLVEMKRRYETGT